MPGGAVELAQKWPQVEWVIREGKRGTEPHLLAHYGERQSIKTHAFRNAYPPVLLILIPLSPVILLSRSELENKSYRTTHVQSFRSQRQSATAAVFYRS